MIYVINQWNGRQYQCHEIDIDGSNKWNLGLHKNEDTPILYFKICGYCGTEFRTRDDLFYHLGFMNIDVRNYYERELYIEDEPQFHRSKETDKIINQIHLSNQKKRKRYRDVDIFNHHLQVEELSKRMKNL